LGAFLFILGFYNRNGFIWGFWPRKAPKYSHDTIKCD